MVVLVDPTTHWTETVLCGNPTAVQAIERLATPSQRRAKEGEKAKATCPLRRQETAKQLTHRGRNRQCQGREAEALQVSLARILAHPKRQRDWMMPMVRALDPLVVLLDLRILQHGSCLRKVVSRLLARSTRTMMKGLRMHCLVWQALHLHLPLCHRNRRRLHNQHLRLPRRAHRRRFKESRRLARAVRAQWMRERRPWMKTTHHCRNKNHERKVHLMRRRQQIHC